MTDLAERLRQIGKGGDGYELTHEQFQTIEEAADVIGAIDEYNSKRENQTDLFINECEGMCGI